MHVLCLHVCSLHELLLNSACAELPACPRSAQHAFHGLQAWGENVKAAVQEFGRELAEQHRAGSSAVAADTPVYFDILGRFLVSFTSHVFICLLICGLSNNTALHTTLLREAAQLQGCTCCAKALRPCAVVYMIA